MQSPTRSPSPASQIAQQSDSQLYPVTPSQYPTAVSQSHDLVQNIAAPSTSTTPRVSPSPPAQSCSETIENDSLGTAENPLIPKRRRRTSPTELAILEEEYRLNPKPDQGERAKVAQRLGMTNRAIQVWYQNRRQKDKKDSSSQAGSSASSSVASGDLSSPKDLDGVSLSFSSSPLPSPQLPLYSTTAASRPPLSSSLSSLKGLPSSSDLYSVVSAPATISNKENTSLPLVNSPPQSVQQAPQPYVYSYPSSQQSAALAGQLSASSSVPSSSHQSVFLHRSSNSSIIAAKKHVRKRPLGSHAPFARTPSLTHSFDFPPSPPKPKPTSARSSSVGCQPSTQAAKLTLAVISARRPDLTRRASSSNGGLFDMAEGSASREGLTTWKETMAQRRSVEETTSSEGTKVDGSKKVAEDLLQHMQSDPPSASSPAPPIRTRIFDHDHATLKATLATADEDSDEDDQTSGSFVPSAFASKRPPLQHSQSLGASFHGSSGREGDPSKAKARIALLRSNSYHGTASSSSSPLSISTSLANSHARDNPFSPMSAPLSSRTFSRNSPSLAQTAEAATSGTDNACALNALERKRARIINEGVSLQQSSIPSSRRRSLNQDPAKERATKRRRSSALTSISTQQSQENEGDDSMAELSFSSTSTASTTDSLVTVDSPSSINGGYFALRSAVEQVEARELSKPGDDERECAELLLGLGGFC